MNEIVNVAGRNAPISGQRLYGEVMQRQQGVFVLHDPAPIYIFINLNNLPKSNEINVYQFRKTLKN